MQISVTISDSMAIKSCESDSHGVTAYDPSPGHSPMGLGQEFGFALDGKSGWSDAVPLISMRRK